ncbi:glycine--tRNA ligase subunit beta [Polaromonas sp.]|uniref:glycine--tRNA ligase subunit beta n=1 Tax=Polaromonas sp. TaxID=1869339 RepID=UPI00272FDC00|nr:glycine--tRNA ligase subunit beta [Polaromonas sp.]MDP1886359.1 glycine--tRNA ligase subunit beta [Polaromonas sp.]
MSTQALLVELFVEELPPKALKKLGEAFAAKIFEGLELNDFLEPGSELTSYATPRRLAVHVTNVRGISQPRPQPPKSLMPASVGLDIEGKPTAPLLKRLRSMYHDEVDILWLMSERVFVAEEGGKKVLKHRDGLAAGGHLFIRLEGAIEDAIRYLPIPKVMTYPNPSGDGWETVNFVRPAHGLIALHGADIVPVSVLGLQAGRETQGHRFEARVSPVSIQSADSYVSQLKDDGAVIASFAERRAEIVRQLQAAAAPSGLTPIDDDALLDEVTALVERPNVLVGQFEEAFLEVPPECLILTMKANQKYFPLLDRAGKLTHQFLIVSNISPDDASAVVQGNERVVRPRLADAKFFFDQDRKKSLESRVSGLSRVVYHNKLGTQGERVERVQKIARWVAEKVDANVKHAERAAFLAKADLLTDMVGEFPELQGIMGAYYARHDGEDEAVAQAIADQYLVRRDETESVSNLVSEVLQIADRMETLVGIWGIGLKPTGDKDPFALRRHALSVIKSFQLLGAMSGPEEQGMQLRLDDLIEFSLSSFPAGLLANNVAEELKLFIYERNANQLAPLFGAEAIAAVFANMPPLHEITKRIKAVREFATLPESPSLAAANKRVGNILKKAEGDVGNTADPACFVESAESALFTALSEIAPKADAAFAAGDYTASLQALAALKAPVDAFFDSVMVNADDPALKANRLALLNQLHQTMNRVADISRLAA